MALFDPCMEFEIFLSQMTPFELLIKCCLRLRPAPSKCLSERINWIISTIPYRISKILFVYQCWKTKLERPHFIKVQSGKITVCSGIPLQWSAPCTMEFFSLCKSFNQWQHSLAMMTAMLYCHWLKYFLLCFHTMVCLNAKRTLNGLIFSFLMLYCHKA